MSDIEAEFAKSYKNCLASLEIIKANFGSWVNQEFFLKEFQKVEKTLDDLENQIFEAGFQDE